jgi:hypothetical protein
MSGREVVYSSVLFRGLDSQPHLVIEGALYLILQNLHFACGDNTGDYLLYRGKLSLIDTSVINPANYFDTILRCFIYFSGQYRQLEPEENYLDDQSSHLHYLRVVVTTATLAFWLQRPGSFCDNLPYDGSLDLSTLPFWVSKIIKKVSFDGSFMLRFEYYQYREIAEE